MIKSNPIKVWFSDFWVDFDYNNNYFINLLKQHFSIEINPKPDVLIHSVYSKNYLLYNCIRICFTGENTRPDFSKSDYHIGFDFNEDPRYLRWPLFLLYNRNYELLKSKNVDELLNYKTRFCSFIVSNGDAKERVNFFHALSNYKKVDSGGGFINNIGYRIDNKQEFLKTCKFTIAFENSSYHGYTTEKIYEPFLAGSVPIYWGNADIAKDFNANAFINAHNFKSNEDIIEYVKYVDVDNELYKKYLSESCFINNVIPQQFDDYRIVEFFERIFNNTGNHNQVAKRKDYFIYIEYNVRKKISNFRKSMKFTKTE